jgi:hypothetical protein
MYANTYGQPGGSGSPAGYPPAGYQVGPPAAYGGNAQQVTYTAQQTYAVTTSSPAPPGVDAELYRLFKAADTDNTNQLTERQLGRALVNGDYTAFDQKTVKTMVNMFDVDR